MLLEARAGVSVEAAEHALAGVGAAVLRDVLTPRYVRHLGRRVVVRQLRPPPRLVAARHVLLLDEVIVRCKYSAQRVCSVKFTRMNTKE